MEINVNHYGNSIWKCRDVPPNPASQTLLRRLAGSSALEGDKKTDVLIIGGGIAGILTAYHLKEIGIKSIVVEAKTLFSGTTGNTTAKITAQHGVIYSDIIRLYGREKARMYYDANTQAIQTFRSLAEHYPCDFETKNSYVYSSTDRTKIEREAEAYRKIGIPIHFKDKIPVPVETKGALMMENQAQFNPLKLLYALADELEIYEHTLIKRIDENKAVTEDGRYITTKYIVLATHFPLINIPGFYFMKLYQHRSYVLTLENAADLNGMYIDEKKDGFSFRNYQNKLLIGGGSYKTGGLGGGYDVLNNLADRVYPGATRLNQWATQDCMSLDGIPYVGRFNFAKRHLFVATGFNKWGMTGAMVTADIISNLIAYGKSEYEILYSPGRFMFTKQLVVNIFSAASGLLCPGKPRCTHMGCKLNKNIIEGTWDCSCHGSRFGEDGAVINNPAKKNIS